MKGTLEKERNMEEGEIFSGSGKRRTPRRLSTESSARPNRADVRVTRGRMIERFGGCPSGRQPCCQKQKAKRGRNAATDLSDTGFCTYDILQI